MAWTLVLRNNGLLRSTPRAPNFRRMVDSCSMSETPPEKKDVGAVTLSWPVRCLLTVFAVVCLVLGLIGAVVPGMPTTVFILMAAWAAVRSSPKLHGWLYAHPTFGPMLRNWDAGGLVSRRVKWTATASMALSAVLVFYLAKKLWLAALAVSIMACVLLWLWLRPEPAE